MFVGRKLDGTIYGAWTSRQPDDADHPGQEELPDDDPEVLAFLAPKPPIDFSNVDNVEKGLKTLALLLRDYTNALQAGTHTQKTAAQLRADFKVKWLSLP